MIRRFYLTVLLLLCFIVPLSSPAFASHFGQVIAFGDSLSDNGADDGYGLGVASNGFVWLDYLAQDLGDSLLDFAQLGARTYDFTGASGPRDGLLSQISQYSTEGINSEALHTIWIGGNDLLNMGAPPDVTIFNAVSTIGSGIQTLYGQGVRNFLVVNMPNFGLSPLFPTPVAKAQAEALSAAFNSALDQVLINLGLLPQIELNELDVFGLMNDWVASSPPLFDDVTGTWKTNGNIEKSLFWDPIHPTTYAHGLIAEAAFLKVVPEPATMLLFGFGLIGLAGVGRKRNK